ncbi:hypothetical protein AC249_AIPGENE28168 [Exaiptasia diaphana]|nr:hypothetical protein AC249_AIPGENE28168 [Exaiptasia diaphana]
MVSDQSESSTSSKRKNESENPRKKRGNYMSWLRDQELKAEPRVSEWRTRKRKQIASIQLEDTVSETYHVAEMSRLEVVEIVEPEGKNGNENFKESIIEEEEFTDDYSCASQEGDVNTDHGHKGADFSGDFVSRYEHYADDEDDLSFCSDTEDNDEEESCKSNSQSSKEYDQSLIYSGARLTLMASMLLVLTFSMKHSLTSDALSDLLILVELHCLSPNVFRTTTRLFNAFFKDIRSPIEFHYYCISKSCYTYLSTNPPELCPTCHSSLVGKKNCSYFVVVPIIQQLQALLNNGNLLQDILNYKASHKRGASITDVLDGNLYKAHFGQDFIGTQKKENKGKKELHISFQINTDGVSLFRSSTFSVWAVYLIINKISP